MGLHLCFFLFHFAFANSVVSVQFSNVSFLKSSLSLLTQFLYQITTFCFICFVVLSLSLFSYRNGYPAFAYVYIGVPMFVSRQIYSCPYSFLVPCPCLRGMTLQRLFYYSSSCLSGHSCNWCF